MASANAVNKQKKGRKHMPAALEIQKQTRSLVASHDRRRGALPPETTPESAVPGKGGNKLAGGAYGALRYGH